MAVSRFKLAFNNAAIPLLSIKAQRAVFVPSLDSAPRTPRGFYGEETSRDDNTAQVIYAENVLPVAEGLRSVSYEQIAVPTTETDFKEAITVRDDEEVTYIFSPSANKNYLYDQALDTWTSTPLEGLISPLLFHADSDPTLSRVTFAYVDGYTFICYSRLKSDETTPQDLSIYAWDPVLKTFSSATVAGTITNLPFPAGEVDGISSSNGYLIVWSGLEVAWARYGGVGTEFDFTISLTSASGGGRQTPEDIKGKITAVLPTTGGFIIFTTKNAIAANYYSQSTISPWLFREVPNAGGLLSYEQATIDSSLGAIIAYTSSGLQRISLNSSEEQFPEVSDFFTGRTTERYDFALHQLVPGAVPINFLTKLTAVGKRFIVVSYGYYPGIYSFALVYDIYLKRWGKLRIKHVDCFHYPLQLSAVKVTYAMMIDVNYEETAPTAYEDLEVTDGGITQAQNAMAFLKSTGEIVMAAWQSDLKASEDADAAVAIIGRVQLSRSRNTQLNRIEIEGLQNGAVYVQPSFNGRTLEATESLTTIEQSGDYLLAGTLLECKNFNIVVEGTFRLSTIVLEAATGGSY